MWAVHDVMPILYGGAMLDVPLRIAQWKNVEELNAIFNGMHTLDYLHPAAEKPS